jgi:hypothetical protein
LLPHSEFLQASPGRQPTEYPVVKFFPDWGGMIRRGGILLVPFKQRT